MSRNARNRAWAWLRPLLRQDWFALLLFLGLLATGLCFVYSASYRGDETGIVGTWFSRQIFWSAAGAACALVLVLADYRFFLRFSGWFYLASLLALVAVLFAGKRIYGAYRWLEIAGVQVQPSEFAKIALVLLLADLLSRPELPASSFLSVLVVLLATAIPFALVLREPDLGTAMVFPPVAFAMLFAAGMKFRHLFLLAGLAAATLPFGWFFLGDYQRDRIQTFLDPSRDPLGAGWNALQSAIAVGSGGLHGKGWLAGTQNVLGFLPRTVSPSDFIFPVFAEETGFVGGLVLIAAYLALLTRYLRIAAVAGDSRGGLLATGFAAILFTHVFVNIGMTIGLLPITGLPLPLLSSGGTFMVCTFLGFGFVQSVYARRDAFHPPR